MYVPSGELHSARKSNLPLPLYPQQLKIAQLASLRKCLLKCVVCLRACLWELINSGLDLR